MKKLFLISMSILFLACSLDDESTFIAPVSHNFEVRYNENYDNKPADNAEIKLVNNDDGKNYTVNTDDTGLAEIDLVPGVYKVNITRTFSIEEYLEFSGQEVDQEVTFNVSMEGLEINANSESFTELELVTGTIGNLIIKQVYYAGSDVRLGASFRDQFVEIHNNSNETIYLDGLHFAQVHGTTSVPSTLRDYHLANGQYDWSKSIGQEDPDGANKDYVYSDEVLRIPGSGQDYPLESGKSVIIAATAVDHKAPLVVTDKDGESKTFEVPEPDRTVDLSQAPFEAYFRPFQESQGSTWLDSDIDNPNSANVEIIFKSFAGKDLILDPMGRDAFVIFFADEVQNWDALPIPSIGADKFSETTKTYLQIPNLTIIDGVEVQRNDPSKGKPKRLSDAIDAGEISGIQGHYTSESVIRKLTKEVDGKTFYQDTNNSSNDFEVLSHPQVEIE